MKLYYKSGTCALTPHIILNELKLDYELEAVDFKTKTTEHGHDYLSINPKGVVPALQLDSGEVITENAVILQYLGDLEPDLNLLPVSGLNRYRCLEFVNYITTEIHKGFGLLFHLDDYVHEAESKKDLKTSGTNILKQKLSFLSTKLDDKNFLMGEYFTIADAYLFVVLSWAKHMNISLEDWSNLKEFYQRVHDRPSTLKALKEEKLL